MEGTACPTPGWSTPDARTLEAYQNDAGTWRPLGTWRGEERERGAPFEGLEIELGWLWG